MAKFRKGEVVVSCFRFLGCLCFINQCLKEQVRICAIRSLARTPNSIEEAFQNIVIVVVVLGADGHVDGSGHVKMVMVILVLVVEVLRSVVACRRLWFCSLSLLAQLGKIVVVVAVHASSY